MLGNGSQSAVSPMIADRVKGLAKGPNGGRLVKLAFLLITQSLGPLFGRVFGGIVVRLILNKC